jgi:hypothetical protein
MMNRRIGKLIQIGVFAAVPLGWSGVSLAQSSTGSSGAVPSDSDTMQPQKNLPNENRDISPDTSESKGKSEVHKTRGEEAKPGESTTTETTTTKKHKKQTTHKKSTTDTNKMDENKMDEKSNEPMDDTGRMNDQQHMNDQHMNQNPNQEPMRNQ